MTLRCSFTGRHGRHLLGASDALSRAQYHCKELQPQPTPSQSGYLHAVSGLVRCCQRRYGLLLSVCSVLSIVALAPSYTKRGGIITNKPFKRASSLPLSHHNICQTSKETNRHSILHFSGRR
jgi:hypothetical protein